MIFKKGDEVKVTFKQPILGLKEECEIIPNKEYLCKIVGTFNQPGTCGYFIKPNFYKDGYYLQIHNWQISNNLVKIQFANIKKA